MGLFYSKISRSAKMASSPEIQKFIKDAVSQEKVVVFSKSYCPYCHMAKEVFQKVKQPIKVYELDQLDDGSAIQDQLVSVTGFRTVPQVFINGNCIGGGTDVKALYDSGKLGSMLIG
ncbi:glutaredoxin-C4-like [Hyposmocoma kahamanoa]|uniref:glutaredoxin-C4-like n=1 Tax=Hyposmocoma kahamanoa TaxID=1477025 RepID=UPI000E6D6B2E|nr:glutaredoxin-C4-like [Hyposmocoma kahamanoa]